VSPSFSRQELGLQHSRSGALKRFVTHSSRPQLPRLLNSESLKHTIARGVENRISAYIGKKPDETYEPFDSKTSLTAFDIELWDDMYIIQKTQRRTR
jgi:hypothetical protein